MYIVNLVLTILPNAHKLCKCLHKIKNLGKKKFRAFLELGQWSSVTLWTLMTIISYLVLISWLIWQWGAVRDTVQRLPLTSGSLQLKIKVLIRKCSSRWTKNVVNAYNLGEMAWEGRSLEMGQEMLLFPDPNLCPWTWCFLFCFVCLILSLYASASLPVKYG